MKGKNIYGKIWKLRLHIIDPNTVTGQKKKKKKERAF